MVQKNPAGISEVRHLSFHIALTVGGAIAVTTMILGCLILWSTQQVDRVTIQRQERLVATVLRQSASQVAHDQEASTVWDDAVEHLQVEHPDPDWLDANLGVWFYTYYRHDEILIVDGQERPIYGMAAGKRIDARLLSYRISPVLAPLIVELRREMRRASAPIDETSRSPGVVNVAMLEGHPAIISVKPIIAESGAISQVRGREFVHTSVRYLDGSFTKLLADQYGFDGARFSPEATHETDEAAVPVTSRDGRVIGFLRWKPFRPGSAVLYDVGATLAASLLAIAAIVTMLIRRIGRSAVELHASKAHALHLAFHDNLTGLPNRALFEDRLDKELARVRRGPEMAALMFLDLDRFKDVNDNLGHPAGDELIRQVAQRLKAMLRETDTVARLGGDEFAIIQTALSSPGAAEILCLRIVEELNQPFELDGVTVNVGVSIGIAVAPQDACDRVELSRKADIALYRAKSQGRGRHSVFVTEMDETVRHRQKVEADLRCALAKGDQLRLYYQPIYSAQAGGMIGAEALVRWQHPEKGLISPVDFIPIAEETGLIHQLGEWVLAEACRAAHRWQLETISVNVSVLQLRSPSFASSVVAILEQTGLDPRRLELEIIETYFMEVAAECAAGLEFLRNHGVRIALDDFGTGYSSLSKLREICIDRVNIDRSFVNGIDSGSGSAIIRAIVDMARANGIDVTAKGVETSEQSDFLKSIGCQSLQGFLMSKPLSSIGLGEMIPAL